MAFVALAHALVLGFSTLPEDLPMPPSGVCPSSWSSGWTKYFSYTGELVVGGHVWASEYSDGGTLMGYHLFGVDPACAAGPDTSVSANSCGIHIHTGDSCEADAGGHYFMSDSDPWGAGVYKTAPAGESTMSWFVVPNTGLSSADMTGKTVIVHGHDGGRIACARLGAPLPENAVGPFTKYFNNPAAPLPQYYEHLSGAKAYSTDWGLTTVLYSVYGVDPACAGGADASAPNSCGIHIHSGTSCNEDALGHYYAAGMDDPWGTVTYTSYDVGMEGSMTTGAAVVYTGLDNDAIGGKVLIVHDRTGARIMCAPIQPTDGSLKLGKLTPYPGYTGELMVDGIATMIQPQQAGAPLTMTYQLKGLDPRCTQPWMATEANACGVHIHEGFSCEEAGGHLYNGDFDPWTSISYTASEHGLADTPAQVVPPLGLSTSELVGRAFVVHDFEGKRVACGLVIPSKMC